MTPSPRSIIAGEQQLDSRDKETDSADNFVELRFKPGTWATKGIPEQGCWIRTSTLDKIIGRGGQYEISDLVDGLIDWLGTADDPGDARAVLQAIVERHYPESGARL